MSDADEAVRARAARQFGLISREEAYALGLSRRAVEWRIAKGDWVRVQQGVYRLSGTPVTWPQQARMATMLAGPGSALSHQTAGFLFRLDGLSDRPPATIDLTVPQSRTLGTTPFRVHRTGRRPRLIWLRGHPVISIAETLCDLAGSLTPLDLEFALDSAHRQYAASVTWLGRHLDDHEKRGLKGLAELRALLAYRLDGATDSNLEARVRRALRAADLPPWRRQLEVHHEGHYVMRIDFAWPAHRVALHVDGYRWHHQRERFERDARQRSRLAALGWQSLVVTRRGLDDTAWLADLRTLLSARAPQLGLALGATFPAAGLA